MTMQLDDLQQHIEDGAIRAVRHPVLDITLYNYTAVCQYEARWCDTTRLCRGLVIRDNGEVVARPFPKFHNYEEHPAGHEAFSKPFIVTEKLDGSLGILYRSHDGWAIATRGSFTSEQAVKATGILRSSYAGFMPEEGLTYLFEILYPGNRVVVDYGEREDLVLIAVIDTASGRDLDGSFGWPGPKTRAYDLSCEPGDVVASLGLLDDGNSEGVVLRFDWPSSGPHFRVKLKLAEYKRLHKLVTGTSTKTVWEALALGSDMAELTDRVPDEFHVWLRECIAELRGRYEETDLRVRELFAQVVEEAGIEGDRKGFAEAAVRHAERAYLFRLYDGHSIEAMIWRELKPQYARPFSQRSEDNA
jgi:RNA ligase